MSASNFNTPPWFLDLVRKLDPKGQIGLDPCSNPTSMVDAPTSYDIVTNGLIRPWRGHGLVFMNPPHSLKPMNIEPWMAKAFEEFIEAPYHLDIRDQFVGLVPSKTGPVWFQDHATAFHKCFLKGRIRFHLGGHETLGAGKFDSVVLYAGKRPNVFQSIFSDYGWCA